MKKPIELGFSDLALARMDGTIKAINANRVVAGELDTILQAHLDQLAQCVVYFLLSKFPQDAPLQRFFYSRKIEMISWIRGSLLFSGGEISWSGAHNIPFFEMSENDLAGFTQNGILLTDLREPALKDTKKQYIELLNKLWDGAIRIVEWGDGERSLKFKISIHPPYIKEDEKS